MLELALPWREAALVRALARYRQQSGLDPSQAVQEAALRAHPEVAALILDLFHARFDPAAGGRGADARRGGGGAGRRASRRRCRRSTASTTTACCAGSPPWSGRSPAPTIYQPDDARAAKPYISFKIASRELADLPAPKPFREIFVSAPHVEGVHLRFGPVARGGLRWSDRRDDFRTEVLGLVKAQQVKNAVIVPVGSKGGFYPKQLPRGGDAGRDPRRGRARLQDLPARPARPHRQPRRRRRRSSIRPASSIHDADDPYLVVAADKGTATFSDIANGVAEDYGFWLGDAFASGGSAGYDHKAMGITARGAWESVKRHFREMGKDIQREPFTVIGVGDMSGDVFGNGMLLSQDLELRAAFDHRHIFLDPDPDPRASLGRAQAAVRPAALILGRLRPQR